MLAFQVGAVGGLQEQEGISLKYITAGDRHCAVSALSRHKCMRCTLWDQRASCAGRTSQTAAWENGSGFEKEVGCSVSMEGNARVLINAWCPSHKKPAGLRLALVKQLHFTSVGLGCKNLLLRNLSCLETGKQIPHKLTVVCGKHPGYSSCLGVIKLMFSPVGGVKVSDPGCFDYLVSGVVSTLVFVAACVLHWEAFFFVADFESRSYASSNPAFSEACQNEHFPPTQHVGL